VRGCPINLPGLPYHRMMRHAEQVELYLTSWAKRRRGELRSGDLLSLIINSPDQSGNPLCDDQIAGQALTLFGASYETCQTVLTWTLFLLAQHPDVSAALLDEVSMVPSDPLSTARLEQWTWLDAVVKESMRLLPPVPLQVRKALRDTDLVHCGANRKTRVILSPFLTNRLSDLYPDGDCFKPKAGFVGCPEREAEQAADDGGGRRCAPLVRVIDDDGEEVHGIEVAALLFGPFHVPAWRQSSATTGIRAPAIGGSRPPAW
jgi:cytochrome P450